MCMSLIAIDVRVTFNILLKQYSLFIGRTRVKITVMEAPKPGTCTLSPIEGVALTTPFSYSCREFYSDYPPMSYSLSYIDKFDYNNSHEGPNDFRNNFCPMPFVSANLLKPSTGSAPVERMNTIGVEGDASPKAASKFNVGDRVYSSPSFSPMKVFEAYMTFSSLKHFKLEAA